MKAICMTTNRLITFLTLSNGKSSLIIWAFLGPPWFTWSSQDNMGFSLVLHNHVLNLGSCGTWGEGLWTCMPGLQIYGLWNALTNLWNLKNGKGNIWFASKTALSTPVSKEGKEFSQPRFSYYRMSKDRHRVAVGDKALARLKDNGTVWDKLQSWMVPIAPCPRACYNHIICLKTKKSFNLWEYEKVVQCSFSSNLSSTNTELNFSDEGKKANQITVKLRLSVEQKAVASWQRSQLHDVILHFFPDFDCSQPFGHSAILFALTLKEVSVCSRLESFFLVILHPPNQKISLMIFKLSLVFLG